MKSHCFKQVTNFTPMILLRLFICIIHLTVTQKLWPRVTMRWVERCTCCLLPSGNSWMRASIVWVTRKYFSAQWRTWVWNLFATFVTFWKFLNARLYCLSGAQIFYCTMKNRGVECVCNVCHLLKIPECAPLLSLWRTNSLLHNGTPAFGMCLQRETKICSTLVWMIWIPASYRDINKSNLIGWYYDCLIKSNWLMQWRNIRSREK